MTTSLEKLKLALQTASDVIETAWKEKTFKADDKIVDERNRTCELCEDFVDHSRKCRVCGCYMDLKMRLVAAKCPIDKW